MKYGYNFDDQFKDIRRSSRYELQNTTGNSKKRGHGRNIQDRPAAPSDGAIGISCRSLYRYGRLLYDRRDTGRRRVCRRRHLEIPRRRRLLSGTVSGGGRPAAQDLVYEWRRQHPEGRKADCHRDTGLDPKTIRKWWDCPPPAVRVQNGHITVRVSPSQAVSDLPVEALGQSED